MTEADYGPSFQIIAAAGDSKGYSISAIKAAQNGEFEQAEADMKEASSLLLEAPGNIVPVNIILVHSQDHLSMAMTAQDLSEHLVEVYKEIHSLKEEIAVLKAKIKAE